MSRYFNVHRVFCYCCYILVIFPTPSSHMMYLFFPDKIHTAEKSFGKAWESTEQKWAVCSGKVSSCLFHTAFTSCCDETLHSFLYLQLNRVTAGYSGSDLTSLAKDAALGPIRGTTSLWHYRIDHVLALCAALVGLTWLILNVTSFTELAPDQVRYMAANEVR